MAKRKTRKIELSSGAVALARSSGWRFYAGVTAAGIAVRMLMVLLSPRYGFAEDHDDLARWALQAVEEGPQTLYVHPPPPAPPPVWGEDGIWKRPPMSCLGVGPLLQVWDHGQWQPAERKLDWLCNYPPLCVYLLGTSGGIFKAISAERVVNTLASRSAIAVWSFIFDILLAAGCAGLAARLTQGRGTRRTYALAFLAPPFWAVSCLWGQVDTWVLAPAVWMIWAMTAGRWGWAGVLFGIVAALKPQAAAFIPVWGMAILICRPAWKPIASLAIAAATLNVVALPFWLHSGATWWRLSYQANLFEHSKGMTTLMAFNLWYLDCLFTRSVNETAKWWGVSKAAWGQAALALTLVGGFVWTLRRFGRKPECLAVWTMLVMLAFVMIPTRVHDRFILLVLPFLICAAAARRTLWPGLLILLVAATGQVTWPQWLSASSADWELFEIEQTQEYTQTLATMPADQRAKQPTLTEFLRPFREDYLARSRFSRPMEWILTILSLGGTALIAVALARLRPEPTDGT